MPLSWYINRGFAVFHDSSIKTARTKGELEAASAFCPFATVENILVAKVGIGERRDWRGEIDLSRDHACPRQAGVRHGNERETQKERGALAHITTNRTYRF